MQVFFHFYAPEMRGSEPKAGIVFLELPQRPPAEILLVQIFPAEIRDPIALLVLMEPHGQQKPALCGYLHPGDNKMYQSHFMPLGLPRCIAEQLTNVFK